MGGGSISHTGPLLVLSLIFWLFPFGMPTRPCYRCYQKLYMERHRGSFFISHTHINSHCYNPSKLGNCIHNGKKYWMAENVRGSECAKGEKWMCFTHITGSKTKDLVKEELISKKARPAPPPKPVPISLDGLYKKLEQQLEKEIDISRMGKNLFVELGERISKELNVTNCWVCGGALMSEEWPWKGSSLGPIELLKWNQTSIKGENRPGGWILSSVVIGEECLWREGKKFLREVGKTPCKRYKVSNGTSVWWIPEEPTMYWTQKKEKNGNCEYNNKIRLFQCNDTGKNPYVGIPEISKFWENMDEQKLDYWKAPDGLFWICGKRAYPKLPPKWKGSCTLGVIQPGFFLLPGPEGDHLGIPVYEDLKRSKRDVIGGFQKWGEDEWPPARILETYGPATWAQDGSWGYRTPIYMLNRIIRLQAVVEIITNKTGRAMELISRQQTQIRAAVYQNRLALDYLLAEEGGVCGKFNTSDCCLKIDDNGEAVLDIVNDIRKIAHVPVQKWESMLSTSWWDNVLGIEWWKKLGFFLLCATAGLIFIPCLIPCFIRLITSVVQGMQLVTLDQKMDTTKTVQKIMVLRKQNRVEDPLQEARLIYEENEHRRDAREQ
ncbi:endogenous retrovirus group 3 member 1 Env polyprotein-like isoform X1 [Prinia subflava]|uniref:endogenous retrovirus group 3 member 1 Env polyprotein-like isoform X1 n=1 Tax=Prinia subflava TaxID=208062 RepID=UPI002FE2701C